MFVGVWCCCSLFVCFFDVGCVLFVGSCFFMLTIVAWFVLRVAHCLMFVVCCCLLFVDCFVSDCCALFDVRCSSCDVCCVLVCLFV